MIQDDAVQSYTQLFSDNRRYADSFDRSRLAATPARKLVVVACMDTRLIVEDILGLRAGEAHVIRNAGAIVTDDVLRSILISQWHAGTNHVVVMGHTDCGTANLDENGMKARIAREAGVDASGLDFLSFSHIEEHVRTQVKKVRNSPFVRPGITVQGLVYQVEDGRLREVV